MPSRNRHGRPAAAVALLSAALLLASALPSFAAAGASPPSDHSPPGQTALRGPSPAEITRAINIVKADPDLATERTIRTLRWVDQSRPEPRDTPASLEWLLQLIQWFGQSARVVVWVAIALLAGLLAIYLVRLIRARNPSTRINSTVAPTHVQDLDIRPESLPDNIGLAARGLWDSGEHRAALSLLYRGLLSRLVHVHNVPIRDSSTEGDCLRLTAARLAEERASYVTRLVRVWQHAVYGGQQPETASLHTLCDGFAPALDVR